MYVCLCNGISDKKIRQAVRQFSPHSFQQLKKFIPVGNQCGKCVRAAREVMEDEWHCCKVSDEAAFCLIQRPYISKTLLTRRISPRGSP